MSDKVKITAVVDGFRRGGVVHSAKGRVFDVSEFTKEQLAQIKAEAGKMLCVHFFKEPDKAESAPKNKGKSPEKQAVKPENENASNGSDAPAADGK